MESEQIIDLLSKAAQYPEYLYGLIILLLVASSFCMPFPEEIVLITSGLIAYSAQVKFPENPINSFTLGGVCFFAVFLSDLLVFILGRKLGGRLLKHPKITSVFKASYQAKIEKWTTKYGAWACGIFRFTPGLRFPGHFMCGLSGIPAWKFILVDGTAALLTVPTQVIAVAHWGDDILFLLKELKITLLSVVAIVILSLYLRNRLKQRVRIEKEGLETIADEQ